MAVLRVREPFAYDEPNGVQRVMRTGDLVDANALVVKGRESMFEAVEETVERATSAPGERRTLSTPKRRTRKDESMETPADETPEA